MPPTWSREPAAWIGLLSAVAAFAVVLGVHVPDGFEAGIAAVITAASAAVIRSKVRPAKHSVAEEDAFVRFGPGIHTLASPGMEVGSGVKVHGAFAYADPAEVKAKSAADLKAEHERIRTELGIAKPATKPRKKATKKR